MIRNEGHNCKFYSGKIKDITVRNDGNMRCRRCGDRLSDDEVNENTLQLVKNKKNKK